MPEYLYIRMKSFQSMFRMSRVNYDEGAKVSADVPSLFHTNTQKAVGLEVFISFVYVQPGPRHRFKVLYLRLRACGTSL